MYIICMCIIIGLYILMNSLMCLVALTQLLNHIDTTTNEELPPLISFSDEIIPDDHSDNKPIPNSNNPTSSSEQWALITDDEG